MCDNNMMIKEYVEGCARYDNYVGQKIISNKNIKTKGMYNSRIYYIHDKQNNKVALRNEKDGEPLLSSKNEVLYFNLKDFTPAYCNTCYRYQGSTIEEEYNIHETTWRMSYNEIYTSLSRGRSLDKIHFDYTARTFDVAKENNEPTIVKATQMAKGEVYVIIKPETCTTLVTQLLQQRKGFKKRTLSRKRGPYF